MPRHYHVLNGNPGCMPDDNQIFTNRREAESYAAYEAAEFATFREEDGRRMRKIGSARAGLIQIQFGAYGAYNFEIAPCDDPDCLAAETA